VGHLKNPLVPLEQRDGESPKFKEDCFILSSLANLYSPLAARSKAAEDAHAVNFQILFPYRVERKDWKGNIA